MLFSFQINDFRYQIDFDDPLDISIPLIFNGEQPNAYGVKMAKSAPFEAGELIGDTRRGGSCNFEQIKLVPHCNGTHTECVGHLTNERISVRDCLQDAFMPAALISVEPENLRPTSDTYAVGLNKEDPLITKNSLEKALSKIGESQTIFSNPEALVVRCLPNDESKLRRTYLKEIPPFFSTEAMQFIRQTGVRHLLVDLPSIDRIFDEGKLSNHRIFWNVAPGSFETNRESLVNHTITELIYVPDKIKDGYYLLNLQIAPFAADASPARPLLFRLKI